MPKSSNSYTGGSGRRRAKPAARRSGAGRFFVGLASGILLSAAAIPAYFYFGHPPVAVSDKPALWEHLTERVAVDRRMARDARPAPFPAGEDAFEGAARTYRSQCAQCHGSPALESQTGAAMVPRAQQFFTRDRRATAARPAGELYWATAFGIRRSGMPAYRKSLSNTQLWQLALLLHSADQELPDPVRDVLNPTLPATAPTGVQPAEARAAQTSRPR
ncbi:c-type cytochrome [Terriglobus aquaticus]|uniref:C-type cytochrome n=1 Tax=Terriglobus aquaticus TaxID=940139 RepID=A0ABW9KJ39_9BACT|nr:cytochrome c [Terriglobus aquaticus]